MTTGKPGRPGSERLEAILLAALKGEKPVEALVAEMQAIRTTRRKPTRRTQLMDAIGRYDHDGVRDLLERERVDPNFLDHRSSETPLTLAVDSGDLATFRLLLDRGADIDFRSPSHPLASAVPSSVFCHALAFLRVAVERSATLRCEPNLFDIAFERDSHLCAAYLYDLDGMREEFEASGTWRADPAAAEHFMKVARVRAALHARMFDTFDALLDDGGFDGATMARFVHDAIYGIGVRYIGEDDPGSVDSVPDFRFLERLIQAGASVEGPDRKRAADRGWAVDPPA
jgi:hypothetical protein